MKFKPIHDLIIPSCICNALGFISFTHAKWAYIKTEFNLWYNDNIYGGFFYYSLETCKQVINFNHIFKNNKSPNNSAKHIQDISWGPMKICPVCNSLETNYDLS